VIASATADSLRQVALDLRPHDRAEVLATWMNEDLEQWAACTAELPGEHYALHAADGDAVAVGGLVRVWPGVAQTWMLATPRIAEVGVALCRQALELHRAAEAGGIHRFQAFAMRGNEDGRTWLLRLGYRPEGIMRRYGRHGEDFLLMARVGRVG
jgi:RimJ/RimL family protein N-acetyltransferase